MEEEVRVRRPVRRLREGLARGAGRDGIAHGVMDTAIREDRQGDRFVAGDRCRIKVPEIIRVRMVLGHMRNLVDVDGVMRRRGKGRGWGDHPLPPAAASGRDGC